jgi:CP family cyanate transporter-like MFS transporter
MPPGRAAARPGGWLLLAVVLFALNLRTVIASLPPLLATIRHDLGLSGGAAGLLTTLPVILFAVIASIAPRLARRFAVERTLVVCIFMTGVGAGLRGIDTTFALFAGSCLAGAAVALGQTTFPVFIRVAHPHAMGRLTGAYSMSLPLGASIAGVLAVPLQHAFGESWARSLAFWALPALLAAVVWLPAAVRGETKVTGRAAEPIRGEPLAWAIATYFGIQSMAFYAALAWLPEMLQAGGWSETSAGTLQAFNSLVSAVPAFVVPVLAARTGRQLPIMLALVASGAVAVIGILVAPAAAPLWMVFIGISQGGALGLGLVLPVVKAAHASDVASLMAMTLTVGYVIAATGPWLLGVLHDVSGGWNVPLLALLAITLLQAIPGVRASR